MENLISGIHHITAIASDPQRNVDFYTQVLGLRLIKKTINFDAPGVYHFYFGTESGDPGTILTFFPFKAAAKGRRGLGEMTFTSFAVGPDSLDFWKERLRALGIPHSDTLERFGDPLIRFTDHDGMGIELVSVQHDQRSGWSGAGVPEAHAIKGFFGATLNIRDYRPTAEVLTEMLNYTLMEKEEGRRYRYGIEGRPAETVDLIVADPDSPAVQSAGSVHHLAFRTADGAHQLTVQRKLQDFGLPVTEVKDRNYFKSIYFREPGGVLFEVATDEPGFLIDESEETLGSALKLPDWAEPQRTRIEQQLDPIRVDYNASWKN
ncbi:glyoxalase family protein [Cyclobacterium lianum]|uniref:Glyoxalase family protein n=1 Tax=Cyclobacterium lianum TaxID=388280 RepID=A0A1M7PIN8_9BACT|nr:ring-cleaving dioxygenase [Cyclobacterium lianum]SHN17072.1 glyoxalase family protein [Cyclobacterium lianum]